MVNDNGIKEMVIFLYFTSYQDTRLNFFKDTKFYGYSQLEAFQFFLHSKLQRKCFANDSNSGILHPTQHCHGGVITILPSGFPGYRIAEEFTERSIQIAFWFASSHSQRICTGESRGMINLLCVIALQPFEWVTHMSYLGSSAHH